MSFITKYLTETATYWAATGTSNAGDRSFAAPRTITVKWEDRALAFTNALGKEQVSAAVVFVREDMNDGDFMELGDATATANPRSSDNAREVQGFRKIKRLAAAEFERQTFLSGRLR